MRTNVFLWRTAGGTNGFLWMLILFLMMGRAARANFSEPLEVVESGKASQTSLSLDPANNVFIATLGSTSLRVDLIGPNLRHTFEVPDLDRLRQDPDMASNSRGGTFLVFSEERNGQFDLAIVNNIGGQFSELEYLTDDAFDDTGSRIWLDQDGNPHVSWIKTRLGTHRVNYLNISTGDSKDVGAGESPSIFVDRDNVVHITYARNNAIWYVNNRGGEFGQEMRAVNALDVSDTRILVDEFGNVFLLYVSGETLYFVTSPDTTTDGFRSPQFVDSGDISDPEMRLRSGGVITIAYSNDGDIYTVQGISDFLLQPVLVLGESTEAVETDPSVIVDFCGNTHVGFVQGAATYYTNNAAEVSADFTVSTTSGQGPLTVQFQDLSSGKVQVWQWNFGDGQRSGEANPEHTYTFPGQYAVTLTVFNADRESTTIKVDYISVQESSNILEIPDQVVLPAQQDVWFPVLATHDEPIQGFQIHAIFDPNVIILKECSLDYTVLSSMDPDIWECNIHDRSVEIGVIFELQPPFETPELAPGSEQALVNLVTDISNAAPLGTTSELRLTNNSELSRIFNIFTVSGFTKLPVLKSSIIRIIDPFQGEIPPLFIRGDATGNGAVDITDAIVILNFLFLGGSQPKCMDAADATDAGRVDISSPINILNYLFLGGRAPAVPFPNQGIDPTEDNLACER